MRESVLVLLLAILALPGLALGQQQYLDVVSGGASAILVNDQPLPQGPITIDVLLTTAIVLDGAQYSLSANLNGMGPGSGDGLITYDMATPWIHGPLPGNPGATGFTGLGGDYVQLIGVGMGNGATMAAINLMGPELYFKTFGQTPLLNNALLASYVIHVTGPVVIGDQIAIMAGADPNNMFGNGYISGAAGGPWDQGAPLIIDIVPEPASILLLLGALPFLRRRR